MVQPVPRLACYDGEGVSYQVHEAGRWRTLLHRPLLFLMSCEKNASCTGLCSQGRLWSRKLTRTPSRILQETNHSDSVSQLCSLLVPRFLHHNFTCIHGYSLHFKRELLSVAHWLPVFKPQLAAHSDVQFQHTQPISHISRHIQGICFRDFRAYSSGHIKEFRAYFALEVLAGWLGQRVWWRVSSTCSSAKDSSTAEFVELQLQLPDFSAI